jgi:hypothetical protein
MSKYCVQTPVGTPTTAIALCLDYFESAPEARLRNAAAMRQLDNFGVRSRDFFDLAGTRTR